MLADAIAAERFRLIRDRTAVFWGFVFPPLAALVATICGQIFLHGGQRMGVPPEATVDLTSKVFDALDGASSPFVALFLLIGAAAIFAGDYRWETWRLITPRNSRFNLLAAKLIVFAEWSATLLLLLTIVSMISQIAGAFILGGRLTGPANGSEFLAKFAGMFLVSWLKVGLIGAVAALAGVLTRSTMGAVMIGLVVVVAQSALAGWARFQPTTWQTLAIPAHAGQLLKAFITAESGGRPEPESAVLGLVFLTLWLAALAAAALMLFKRQDLTKE